MNPLPQFAGTNTTRPTPAQRQEVIAFVGAEYAAGRSLRELAELTTERRPRSDERSTSPACLAAHAGPTASALEPTRRGYDSAEALADP